ncbi:hypothetical protein ACNKHX_09310 [Shigella flexneri]
MATLLTRGGKKPNYHADLQPARCCTSLIDPNIWWWISATANQQHRRQLEVCEDICQQIRNGSTAIAGIMAESFLREANPKNRRQSAAHLRSIHYQPASGLGRY